MSSMPELTEDFQTLQSLTQLPMNLGYLRLRRAMKDLNNSIQLDIKDWDGAQNPHILLTRLQLSLEIEELFDNIIKEASEQLKAESE